MAAPPPARRAWRRVTICWTRATSELGTRMFSSSGRSGIGVLSWSCLQFERLLGRRGCAVRGTQEERGTGAPAEPHLVTGGDAAEALVAGAPLAGDDLLARLEHRDDLEVVAEDHRRLALGRRALAARVRVHLLGPQPEADALADLRLAHHAADAEARAADGADQVLGVALQGAL